MDNQYNYYKPESEENVTNSENSYSGNSYTNNNTYSDGGSYNYYQIYYVHNNLNLYILQLFYFHLF